MLIMQRFIAIFSKINNMEIKIKSFVFSSDDNTFLTHIVCNLNQGQKFDVEICDYYLWLITNNQNLERYVGKFETWDDVTDDLLSLEFDFKSSIEEYLTTQFSHDDISIFSYT